MKSPGPDIGEVMPDGTVYAGRCPKSGRRMFTTGSDTGLKYADGKIRPKADFNGAVWGGKFLNDEKRHGHDDWFLPDMHQMQVLADNREKIGGMRSGCWYWTSSEISASNAWMGRMGRLFGVSNQNKGSRALVRCIRLEPEPPPEPPKEPAVIRPKGFNL